MVEVLKEQAFMKIGSPSTVLSVVQLLLCYSAADAAGDGVESVQLSHGLDKELLRAVFGLWALCLTTVISTG